MRHDDEYLILAGLVPGVSTSTLSAEEKKAKSTSLQPFLALLVEELRELEEGIVIDGVLIMVCTRAVDYQIMHLSHVYRPICLFRVA